MRAPGALRALALLAAAGCDRSPARPPAAGTGGEQPFAARAPLVAPPPPGRIEGPLRFLALGGGPTPESNEVSLEQDIELVQRTLPGPGFVLFAGGSSSATVRELAPSSGGDPLRLALGDLMAPRAGRQSRYRFPRFSAERATLANVEARLAEALSSGARPLLVYIAGHGDRDSEPRHNAVALWGGRALSVARLAELHEQHPRPLRLISTTCFSGGFAELAFAAADGEAARPAPVPRCGVFAGTADRETSGCDPNPDRRAQESYGLHLAHALAGARRDGTPLPLAEVDFDGDGTIGLLDAHTWARIEAVSVDVPTTTSERWLRSVAPDDAPIDAALLPEEVAVVERLGAKLGLPDEARARQRWAELDAELAELDEAIDAAEAAAADSVADLATRVLERWPVLDDPYHPTFEATLERNRADLEALLRGSPEARARAAAEERAAAAYRRYDPLAVEEARVYRLLRAYETLHRAAALQKQGGAAAQYYAELLACERAAP